MKCLLRFHQVGARKLTHASGVGRSAAAPARSASSAGGKPDATLLASVGSALAVDDSTHSSIDDSAYAGGIRVQDRAAATIQAERIALERARVAMAEEREALAAVHKKRMSELEAIRRQLESRAKEVESSAKQVREVGFSPRNVCGVYISRGPFMLLRLSAIAISCTQSTS
jgi:hypothetical protein